MTTSGTFHTLKQADAHLANLLHLADALPEFAVSAAFGGAGEGDGGTVTDVLAQVLAEQEAIAGRLAADAATPASPHLGEDAALNQHAHRPYDELRKLIEERHSSLREAALTGDNDALGAIERLTERYEWAHSVLGQCAL